MNTWDATRLLNWWRAQEQWPLLRPVNRTSRQPVIAVARWLTAAGVDPWRDCRPREADKPGGGYAA